MRFETNIDSYTQVDRELLVHTLHAIELHLVLNGADLIAHVCGLDQDATLHCGCESGALTVHASRVEAVPLLTLVDASDAVDQIVLIVSGLSTCHRYCPDDSEKRGRNSHYEYFKF